MTPGAGGGIAARPGAAIAAAIACVAVVGVGLSLSIPLLSIELQRRGATGSVVGLSTAVAGLGSLVALPFVPRLAARVGVPALLALSIATAAGCLLAFPRVPGVLAWFPLRALFSAALGALFVLSEYWINAAAPPRRRGLVMGVYATVLGVGLAAGPALLAAVGTEGEAPFRLGAGLVLAGALPVALARGLSPALPPGGGRGPAAYLRLAPGALAAGVAYGAVETGAFAILPLYGLRLGYGAEAAAGLVGLVAAGNVLFQIPVGWLADRLDRDRVLLAAALAGAAGAGLIPALAGSRVALSTLLVAWGGLAGTLYTVGLASLGARVPTRDLAGANAAFVAAYTAGLVVGPPLVGAGLDLAPPHGLAPALALPFLACAAVLALERARQAP